MHINFRGIADLNPHSISISTTMSLRIQSLILAGLIAFMASSNANAGIVLTPVQISAPTATNVVVNLYGTYDGVDNTPGGNSNLVGVFNFRTSISGAIVGLAATQTHGADWASVVPFSIFPNPIPNVVGSTIEWRAINGAPGNVTGNGTIGTAIGASTLIGQITFTAPIGVYTLTQTALASDVAGITGFGFVNPANNAIVGQHVLNAPPTNITVTAVPEPSTFVLCGLAFGAWGYRVRRKR